MSLAILPRQNESPKSINLLDDFDPQEVSCASSPSLRVSLL